MQNEAYHVYEDELKRDRFESVYNDLKGYDANGIKIRVRGKQFPLRTCAEIMTVNEDDCYMPDMVEDAHGNIVEINYDFIDLR